MKPAKTGRKKPLTLDEVRAIRTLLSALKYSRDRALFEIAIASSLRESDVLSLRVSDILAGHEIREVIRVMPQKTARTTGAVIAFQLTDYAKQVLKDHIEEASLSYGDFLFTRRHSRSKPAGPLSKRAFLSLLKSWVAAIGMNPELYGTHSLRRTRPALVYAETKNLRACQVQLGNASITTTQKYLGIEEEESLEVFRGYQI